LAISRGIRFIIPSPSIPFNMSVAAFAAIETGPPRTRIGVQAHADAAASSRHCTGLLEFTD
jgi:hypothetical protein